MCRDNEKLLEYKKLIKARNRFSLGLIVVLVFVILLYNILNTFSSKQGLVVVIAMILGILGFIFVVFGFLMKDICPWCKQNFFFRSGSQIKIKSPIIFFQRNCGHCHKPKSLQSDEYIIK